MEKTNRIKVKYAEDCSCEPGTGSPWCEEHKKPFSNCPCLDPSEAAEKGYALVEINGEMWAEKI